jgi:hypothetical protein
MRVQYGEQFIRFKFSSDELNDGRASLFRAELKMRVPPRDRTYDPLNH